MNMTPSSAPRVSTAPASRVPRVDPAAASGDIAAAHMARTARHGNWPAPGQQDDAAQQAGNARKRALVLGGGGAAGNAWEIGVIAGLAEAGIDVTEADLIVGTSAGSTAAAQITSGKRPADLYAAVLAEAPQPQAGNARQQAGNARQQTGNARQQAGDAGSHAGDTGPRAASTPPAVEGARTLSGPAAMEWSKGIIDSARDASDMRSRMGATALDMDHSDGSGQARWRDIVAARLPSQHWPEQRVLITAVDAQTGEPAVFDRHSGVDLVDAVAASTTHGFGPFPPYRIGERRYLDGGYRRNENADLAAGYGRVLVLSPFGGRSRMPPEWGMDLATQVRELRAAGSRVETVFPDSAAGDVFNARALDPATRRQAARGGYDQGRALAERLAEMWR